MAELHLPVLPPIEPMLAKPSDGLPDRRRLAVRAEVGRLPRDGLPRRRRDLHAVARPQAARPLLPGARRAAAGEPPGALRPRRRDRHLARRGAPVRAAAPAHPSRRVAGEDAGRGVAGELRGVGPPRARRRGPARDAAGRAPGAAGGGPGHGAAADPPDPGHPRPRHRRRLVRPVRRGRPRRGRRQAARRRRTSPASGRCSRSSTSGPPIASVAGFRWHKNGPGTHVGSLLLGLFDDEGTLHHVGVTSSFTWDKREALAAELAPLRDDALANHPWKDWAEWAGYGEADASGQRLPGATSRWNRGKDLSWEPLRVERVAEVAYDHLQGDRFRHGTTFKRWRPDKAPADCRYDQLEETAAYEIARIFGA